MKAKKLFSILLAVALTLSLFAGCGGSGSTTSTSAAGSDTGSGTSTGTAAPTDETVTIKMGGIYADETGESQAMYKFKELVESKSDTIKVDVYTNCLLGSEEVQTDAVRQGSLQMAVTGTTWASYLPYVAIGEYAFLFNGWDHAKAALTDPEIIADLSEGIEDYGAIAMGLNPAGFRVISSNKPIESMADFQGFRLRVPNIAQYVTMAECLGTNAITMAMTEIFTSLEQKVVDGQENAPSTIIANKYYEVQKYIIVTDHMLTAHLWTINSDFYNTLSDTQKDVIQSCVTEAIDWCWDYYMSSEESDLAYLKEQGLTVTYPSDEFAAAMRQSMVDGGYADWFEEQYPGSGAIVETIKNYQY